MRLFHDKVYHILLISSGMGCKCQDTVVLFNEISGGNPLECIHCPCMCYRKYVHRGHAVYRSH